MLVLLPYPSFAHSAQVVGDFGAYALDVAWRDCEAVLTALRFLDDSRPDGASRLNSPATRAWWSYHSALGVYETLLSREMSLRGRPQSAQEPYQSDWTPNPLHHWGRAMELVDEIRTPPWLGDDRVHVSHRSRLLRAAGRRVSGSSPAAAWTETDDLEIYWPED